MNICYCDLCGQPVKTIHHRLFIAEMLDTPDFNEAMNNYYKNMDMLEKNAKDICDSCRAIINTIFLLRKEHLHELESTLEKLFKLPPYKNE